MLCTRRVPKPEAGAVSLSRAVRSDQRLQIKQNNCMAESPGVPREGSFTSYSAEEMCRPTERPLWYMRTAALFLESRADQIVIGAPVSSSASLFCCADQLEGINI